MLCLLAWCNAAPTHAPEVPGALIATIDQLTSTHLLERASGAKRENFGKSPCAKHAEHGCNKLKKDAETGEKITGALCHAYWEDYEGKPVICRAVTRPWSGCKNYVYEGLLKEKHRPCVGIEGSPQQIEMQQQIEKQKQDKEYAEKCGAFRSMFQEMSDELTSRSASYSA